MGRKIVLMEPFLSLSGKLQKESYRCTRATSTTPANPEGHKYFISTFRALTNKASYNFRDAGSPEPSATQLANETKFTTASMETAAIMADEPRKQQYIARFKQQTKYKYLRGFIFAEEYKKL